MVGEIRFTLYESDGDREKKRMREKEKERGSAGDKVTKKLERGRERVKEVDR